MTDKFIVSASPHYRSENSTRRIMLDVIIALAPALCIAVIYFGFYSLILTAVSVVCCEIFEQIFNLIRKRKPTKDLSAVVTGILLAFCVPPTVPVWLVIIGDLFAIVIVKELFGGLGKNIFNPALAARAFLFSWPALMTSFVSANTADAVSSATPLASLDIGKMPEESLWELFIGEKSGCIGEVCIAAILLGAAYLLFRRVISWHIPVAYIGTVALLTFVLPVSENGSFDVEYMAAQLMSGGLMLGAFFMATDYTTSPVTHKGMLIYGVGCGLLTVFIRMLGSYSEGVSYAILLMNIFAVVLDRATKPKRFGKGGAATDVGRTE